MKNNDVIKSLQHLQDRSVDYFCESIRILIDDVYLPLSEYQKEEFICDRIMKLRGALDYAVFMGLIDKGYWSSQQDTLNALYKVNYDAVMKAANEKG